MKMPQDIVDLGSRLTNKGIEDMSWFNLIKAPPRMELPTETKTKFRGALKLNRIADIIEKDPAGRASDIDKISGMGYGVKGGTSWQNRIKNEPYYQIDVKGSLSRETVKKLRNQDFLVTVKKRGDNIKRYEIRPYKEYLSDSNRREKRRSARSKASEYLKEVKEKNRKFQEKADKITTTARQKHRLSLAQDRVDREDFSPFKKEEFRDVKDLPYNYEKLDEDKVMNLLMAIFDNEGKPLTDEQRRRVE